MKRVTLIPGQLPVYEVLDALNTYRFTIDQDRGLVTVSETDHGSTQLLTLKAARNLAVVIAFWKLGLAPENCPIDL